MSKDFATPMLDELEQGPWPSFVTHMKQAAEKSKMSKDLLGLLERSFQERIGHWKHGGIVGVMGYGGGVIGRYSDLAEDYPEVSQFHTMRVNHPAGWYYSSDALRTIADIWEEHGSGLTNFHGSTGDIILLGTTTDQLEPIFSKLTEAGFDLGGSGSDMRTPSCCLGESRCEWACYDSMGLTYELTMAYQDELHRPAFPYKFKIKCSACPIDCVAAQARADLSVIGTWRDEIRIDADEVKNYADSGMEIERDVIYNCPTRCMEYDRDSKTLKIDDENCVKCMHCIRAMPKALRPGKDRGATLLLGAKAPIVEGALLSSVLVPFIKLEPPYDEIKELIENIWDFWCENGRNRERVGEMIERIGLPTFLEGIGMDPQPEMVLHPRENPYVFYDLEEESKKNGNGSGS